MKISPRGRPRSFDTDLALERVLEVFWDRGFAATSLDELAAAAGLNRPNLAAAFGDKRALYLAALTRFRERLEEGLTAALDNPGPIVDALDAFYGGAIALYTTGTNAQRGCLIMCSAPAESVSDADVRALLGSVHGDIDTALRGRIETAQDAGEIAPDADCTALAMTGTAILQSLALRARAGAAPETLHAFAKRAVRALVA
jgi:AcrR family transcriptional regulator